MASILSTSSVISRLIIDECLIDFCEVQGKHTGDNLSKVVWASLKRYEIHDRASLLSDLILSLLNNSQ
jgi:hypothetical protein